MKGEARFRLYLVSAVLLLVCLPCLCWAQPEDEQVRSELQQILSELDGKPVADISPLVEVIVNIIGKIVAFILRNGSFFVILLILIILFAFFFVIRKLWPGFQRDPAAGNRERTVAGGEAVAATGSSLLYQQALAAAAEGRFSLAVVLLHRDSVAGLIRIRILPGDVEFTNSDILFLLSGNKQLYSVFAALARAAERVLFREDELVASDFDALLQVYMQVFRGLGA